MPVVWQMPDGSLRLTRFTQDAMDRTSGVSNVEKVAALAEIERTRQPELAAVPYVLVPSAGLPTDRAKRNAWRLVGTTVVEDATAYVTLQDSQRASKLDTAEVVKTTLIWALSRILKRAPTPAEIDDARTQWLATHQKLYP